MNHTADKEKGGEIILDLLEMKGHPPLANTVLRGLFEAMKCVLAKALIVSPVPHSEDGVGVWHGVSENGVLVGIDIHKESGDILLLSVPNRLNKWISRFDQKVNGLALSILIQKEGNKRKPTDPQPDFFLQGRRQLNGYGVWSDFINGLTDYLGELNPIVTDREAVDILGLLSKKHVHYPPPPKGEPRPRSDLNPGGIR
jgi:hypothetical protein